MRKRIWIILPIISFIVFVSLYLVYDSKGYEYGLGCDFCNKSMPYNLEPMFYSGYPQSFYLKDEDDFELVGSGFRYQTTDFAIKDFMAYGYNDTSVIAKVTDSLTNVKYLISYETGYKSKKGNPEISFKELSNNDFEQVKDKYKWFEVDKENVYAVDRNKFLSMLGALLSLFFLIRKLLKLRKPKATD
jgi:hypothetical protein